MNKPKTHRIVLYRLTTDAKLSKIDLTPARYHLEHNDNNMKLYIKKVVSDPPWLPFLSPLISDSSDLKNERRSFVLLCQHKKTLYALTGGSGYHTIKEWADSNFGLELSCKMIGPDQISALNQRPLKGETQQISRMFSSYDPRLDIDNYHRLVRFVAGKGNFEGRNFTISGRTNVALRTIKKSNDLVSLFEEVESILQEDDKIEFPRSFRQVVDETLKKELEEEMENIFEEFWNGGGDRESIYIEFENPMNQIYATQFDLFPKGCRKPVTIEDFDLHLLKDSLASKNVDAKSALNNLRVSVKNEDGIQIEYLKSLRSHMACNLTYNDRVFLKQGNDWIEILEDAIHYADTEIAKLTVEKAYMPNWTSEMVDEDAYNATTAKSKAWLSIHPKKITIQGHSNIEPCDLYDATKKRLIHVKDTWGSKSSYLYLQASTSATFFADHAEFRKKVNTEWPNHFDTNFQQDEMTVVIALAAGDTNLSKFPNKMTYFAKINLLNAVQDIRSKGFRVILAPILRKYATKKS